MPSVSDKQQRAMAAAAGGNSTLGIPKSVGKEFMMADALRKGNYTDGNGTHHTHWAKNAKKYGGSNQGGAAIGSAS